MSKVLTIDNRDYIPAGEVGKRFGYTRDYMLILARDGKIDGRKIGHRWFINPTSAELFFKEAKVHREERRQIVREVRRAELRSFETQRKKTTFGVRSIEILAIVTAGLVMGAAGYVGTWTTNTQVALSYTSDAPFLEKIAVSLYNFISPDPQDSLPVSETMQQTEGTNSGSTSSVTQDDSIATRTVHTSLVIGSGEVLTVTEVEEIRNSFSDDVSVSVDPHNPDTGIIIPHFKDGDGEEYRCLMVPVNDATTE